MTVTRPRPRRPARRAAVNDPVSAYARGVVEGAIVAGGLVRLASARHLRDMREGRRRGLEWSPAMARAALAFFADLLVLPDGARAGEPFVLETWQRFVVGSLVGWLRADGARRFRTAYVETGKGSGKTPVAAGMAVYGLVADEEPGAQIFTAAVSREQAHIPFVDCGRILGPALRRRLDVLEHNIADHASGSFIRPVSSEGRSLDGKRVHMAIVDELHEHPSPVVVQKMSAGTKGRRQPLVFEITNSGYDRHTVCWEHHSYSRRVLEGAVDDDEWFAYVCGLDPCASCRAAGKLFPQDECAACDDWRDERVWPKANPLLGRTIGVEYLRKQVRQATEMPSMQGLVQRLNFCLWTDAASRWFTAEQWAACGAPVDLAALRGRPAILGVDLADTDDLAAAVLLVPSADFFAQVTPGADGAEAVATVGGHLDVLCFAWCPEARVTERLRQGRPEYAQWRDAGALLVTDGNVIDHRTIRRRIVALREQDGAAIERIAYDAAHATQFAQGLQDEDGFTVVPVAQGYAAMTEPCIMLETLVKQRRLRHGDSPVLRWAASNVVLTRDAGGRRRPDKAKSSEKIDPIAALVTGLHQLVALHPRRALAYYETAEFRGV